MWLTLLLAAAHATTLDELLARGELSLLETWPDGRLRMTTAIARVDAPADRVWAMLTDFAGYERWMPQVTDSTVLSSDERSALVDWTIAVVGPNIAFRGRYQLDRARWTITGAQESGALAGSTWEWRLEPEGERTLVYRSVRSNVVETNWIVRSVEDENHTLDYGINVATGVVELRGLIRALAR